MFQPGNRSEGGVAPETKGKGASGGKHGAGRRGPPRVGLLVRVAGPGAGPGGRDLGGPAKIYADRQRRIAAAAYFGPEGLFAADLPHKHDATPLGSGGPVVVEDSPP